MDETGLKLAKLALQWEYNYRNKNENKPGKGLFLSPGSGLDPDFEKHLTLNTTCGNILDIGTGTGEQALYLAQMGYRVTGIDLSATAITQARELALSLGILVDFQVDDILQPAVTGPFDAITDRGCFTLIPPSLKSAYPASIRRLLRPGGRLFLKADRDKNNFFTIFDETEFKIEIREETAYASLKNIPVPAVFLVIRYLEL